MKRRNAIAMTDEEVHAYLEEQRTLIVASLNRDGTPHLVAMWYVLLDDGAIAFWTYGKSQKILNLQRDPRITLLVESGETYDQLRGVQLTGRAELVEDRETVQRVGVQLRERYSGRPVDDQGREGVARSGAKRVVVIVRPEGTASWDHRKLGGGY
jgi:PPOX class probable F420-dependent enzyme